MRARAAGPRRSAARPEELPALLEDGRGEPCDLRWPGEGTRPAARRALVVDDDRLARRLLGDALAEQGFEVHTAADGAEGMSKLLDLLLRLDLLVLDLCMPQLDGERLVSLIRRAGGEHDLTVVVVSGLLDAQTTARLLAAGANAALSKAAGAGEIVERAIAAMRAHQRARRGSPA